MDDTPVAHDSAFWQELGDTYAVVPGQWWKKVHALRAYFCYEQAASIDPSNAELLFKVARHTGNDKALTYINRAIALDAENMPYRIYKAEVLGNDLNRTDEALDIVEQVLEREPNNISALLLKASLVQDKVHAAMEENLRSEDVPFLLQTAHDLHTADMTDCALKFVDRALALHPEDRYLWTTKYWYLESYQRHYDAVAIPAEKLLFTTFASIEEFCRSGRYGPLTLGMSRAQVRAALGPPSYAQSRLIDDDEVAHEGRLLPPISDDLYELWSYGSLEIYFGETDLLFCISCDHLPYWPIYWNTTIRLDPWIYRHTSAEPVMTKDEFERGLRGAQIPYVDLGRKPIADTWLGYLQLESGVEAIYEEERNGAIIISMLHLYDNKFKR